MSALLQALPLRLIPCLDVRDGRVVKGVRFSGLRDAGDPAERAALYEREGADELCLLDVSATAEGQEHALRTVELVRRELSIPLTVGGGVRSCEDARRLLEAGADKVSVNSAAVRRPALLSELAQAFGSQCVVLAVDAKRVPGVDRGLPPSFHVTVEGGRREIERSAIDWCEEGVALGAGEILLTSWDRDGTGQGYDLELLERVVRSVRVPVIASGGASGAIDLARAADLGAAAVLVATLLHDGLQTADRLKSELQSLGIRVRS